ncbi:MAG: hypothetical protein HOV87_34945 [Catenulispora sp.]|nr:hypothetical protein [Catenulispora sp.]
MRNGLVEGVSLRDVLRESGAMAPEAAATVLSGTLLTLAVQHGDVRPENVLVDASGGLTVTGFGGPDPEFTPDEPTYLAPERLAGGPATPAADVFAATAVFFECLTAEPPFRAATPEDLNALHEYTQIIAEFAPAELRPLIQRGLTADPAARPADPHAFLAEVDSTATAAYGTDWQLRGRTLLGGWAAAVAAAEGAELAEPDEMPEPPPIGEPIDERLLGLDEGADEPADDPEPEGEPEPESGGKAEAGTEAEADELPGAFGAADTEFLAEDDEEGGSDAADDLLSAFDELAPHTETHSEPDLEAGEPDDRDDAQAAGDETPSDLEPAAEAATETEPAAETASEREPAPATTLLLETAAAQTTKTQTTKIVVPSAAEPLVPPSVQADIDHDWEIPSKPSLAVPRSLSAYANSLPSLPRPAVPEPEPAEPVATSAPDDWFRPGLAEPADRGPRPTRQTAFLDPDKERTTVAADGFDEDFHEPETGEEPADPGGPRRKTLVGAVTAAVLLVAGAAAVVLGGSGDSGPSPAAQLTSRGATPDSPTSTDSVPATPTGTDNSSTLQTSNAAPSSKHTTPRSSSTSKTTKPTVSGATSSTHSSSPSTTESSTSASSSPSSSDSSTSSSTSSTSSTSKPTTPTPTKSSPSGHPSTPTGTPTS